MMAYGSERSEARPRQAQAQMILEDMSRLREVFVQFPPETREKLAEAGLINPDVYNFFMQGRTAAVLRGMIGDTISTGQESLGLQLQAFEQMAHQLLQGRKEIDQALPNGHPFIGSFYLDATLANMTNVANRALEAGLSIPFQDLTSPIEPLGTEPVKVYGFLGGGEERPTTHIARPPAPPLRLPPPEVQPARAKTTTR